MKAHFSETQNKVINKIWIFGVVLFSISMILYFIDMFTPNTPFFKQLFRTLFWFFNSLIIAWYFYKNKKIQVGMILQALSIPCFFRNDISFLLDYHFTSILYKYIWYKSDYIYKLVQFITFMLPFLYFVKQYFKLENAHSSKKTNWFFAFLISLVLINVIDVEVDDIFQYFTFLNFSEPYIQDILVTIIEFINTFKILFIVIGFFYITNRFGEIKSLIKPIEEQFIDKSFFNWGFIISFSILFLTLLNLGQSIFTISVYSQEFNFSEISKLVSSYFLLFYSGRFLGNLIQFRGYSLKKYFGILNTLTLAPLINTIPFLVLLLSKKTGYTLQYFDNLKKNKNLHLTIYCLLITAFLVYDYFQKEVKETNDLIKIPICILAQFLVARFKISTKIVPFALVLFLYFEKIKAFFDFTEGYLFFFKDKILSFLWLSSFAIFLVYYVIYYVLHKCFYVAYSSSKNQEKLIVNIEKFN
ncbi:hypothetical protein FNW52_10890 [Flavobacterium sp. ZT3R18]|uniref:hypothetical protein n=1 Tax=Flavobacterium sp. ZT3R18 TaxID=2594429 RepID=UPI00117B2805|nr:hypothetical protein [Flavobacterium sp. ZT3R18]TRX35538.1 hypothetical protein FNW52_10890 [Flavobacterium sp. ZT3R18]